MGAPIGAYRRALCAEARRRIPLDAIGGGCEAIGALRIAVDAKDTGLSRVGKILARLAWIEEVETVTWPCEDRCVLTVYGTQYKGATHFRFGNSLTHHNLPQWTDGDVLHTIVGRPPAAVHVGSSCWKLFWLLRGKEQYVVQQKLEKIATSSERIYDQN